jgi:hypothetical protein
MSRAVVRCARVATVAVLSCTAACTSWSSNRPVAEYAGRQLPAKVRVTTTLGTQRLVHAPRIETDSLIGHAGDSTNIPVRRPNTRISIPLAQVRTISTERVDAGLSAVVVIGTGLVVLYILLSGYGGGY